MPRRKPSKSFYDEAETMDWEFVEEVSVSKGNYPGYMNPRGVFIPNKTQVEELKHVMGEKILKLRPRNMFNFHNI